MEFHQLRYFIALARERNFLKAARASFISQPTLSQQIKKLEDELGSPLFERSPKGASLTPAGKKFMPYAINILDQLEKGVHEIKEGSGQLKGKITVGTIPTIGPYLLPEILIELKQKAPDLKIELYEETTSIFLDSIKRGKVDLGIISLPIADASLVTKPIGREEFFLAVSKKHPLSKLKSVSTQIIKHEKLLILQEGHCFSDQALEFCKRMREDAQVIFQGSSLTSVLKLAVVGEGLTLVPEMAVQPKEFPALAFIPFSVPKPSREIGIVWRVSAPLSRAQRLFIETAEKTLKEKLLRS